MIVLLLILFSIFIVLNAIYITYYTTTKTIDDIYNLSNTGDLIYFRWHEVDFKHEVISPFTHVSVVLVHPGTGKKYSLETHLAGDGVDLGVYKGGINIYPLKDRLHKYEGHTFLSKVKYVENMENIKNINVNDFLSKLDSYTEQIPFHNDYKGYFMKNCLKKRVCKDCFTIEEKDGLFCSEFVGFCLKEFGLVPKEFDYNCLAPGDFRYVKNSNGEKIYGDNLIKVKKN
jgi:hypothetical protein